MRLTDLRRYFEDKEFLDKQITFYKEKRLISTLDSRQGILGHIEKSRHNLSFLEEIKEDYNDWALVVCYYSSYHAALSLLLTKNIATKSHDAALCLLIRHFYRKGLLKEDIELLNLLNADDLLFYADSKNRRVEASYSTKIMFDKNDVDRIKELTVKFVIKVGIIIFKNNLETKEKHI